GHGEVQDRVSAVSGDVEESYCRTAQEICPGRRNAGERRIAGLFRRPWPRRSEATQLWARPAIWSARELRRVHAGSSRQPVIDCSRKKYFRTLLSRGIRNRRRSACRLLLERAHCRRRKSFRQWTNAADRQ